MSKNKLEKFMSIIETGAKALFGVDEKQSFKSSKLINSETDVDYSVEIGGTATQAGANGSEPLTDGEHTLANGDVITVKNGIIEAITIAEPETETETELAKEDEKEKESEKAKEDEGDVEISIEEVIEDAEEPKEKKEKTEDVDALKAEIESLKEEIKSLKGEFSKVPNKEDLEKEIFASVLAKIKKTTVKAEDFSQEVIENKAWTGFNRK